MEKDSHYYVIYFLCLAAGFDPETAYVLIARNAINRILSDLNKTESDMTNEELSYDWDSTVNKTVHLV